MQSAEDAWPALPYDQWADSCATLQLWTQIVGKIRMALAPVQNHWWHVPLYLTARGLTTSPMPHTGRLFQIDFDFIDHQLLITTSDGKTDRFALVAMPVAFFHAEIIRRLRILGLDTPIWTMPVEIADPIRFEDDHTHASYDPVMVNRFWRALGTIAQIFAEFRGGFLGKASPVHFFWGSFDLAVTRFSGRAAPVHPSIPGIADIVIREAYSHEVSSCGFWPGNGGFGQPAFYAYAYPEPAGFTAAPVRPSQAHYATQIGEFILPYDTVRQAADPRATLLAFLEDTYVAAATHGGWDRAALEKPAP
jgi:hypothetical protein